MSKKQQIIAVNATALTAGGGLTILQQFVDHIKEDHPYYIFITNTISLNLSSKNNVTLIQAPPKSLIQRLLWDFSGLRHWFKKKNIHPDVIISLQNTSVRYPRVKQMIYLHQGLCLHPKKWSFFKKNERMFAIYKYIYPVFILLYANKETHFVVQTEWMKTALCEKFKRKSENVHVIKPNMVPMNIVDVCNIALPEKYRLFYPANDHIFKNHKELINALNAIQGTGYDMSSIGLYLTISPNDHLISLLDQFGLRKQVHFLGAIRFEEVLTYYKSCTIVVFPSYIESFGLPLLEACMFGKRIVAADLSYAKEVLKGYPGVYFASINSSDEWKDAILQALNSNREPINGYTPQYDSSWQDLFQMLHRM